MTCENNEHEGRSREMATYEIDVIREFGALVFIYRMADVSVGPLHCDFSGFGRDACLLLLAQLDVELWTHQWCPSQPGSA